MVTEKGRWGLVGVGMVTDGDNGSEGREVVMVITVGGLVVMERVMEVKGSTGWSV